MDDRLDCALKRAIYLTKDKRTKQILKAVRELNGNLGYMDWSDWIDYSTSEEYNQDLKSLFG